MIVLIVSIIIILNIICAYFSNFVVKTINYKIKFFYNVVITYL